MPSALQVVDAYYQALQGRKGPDAVPMRKDLSFKGPIRTIAGDEEFRGVVARLAGQVRSLTVRRQLSDGEYVVTIYDLDLGAGPIPMAECVRVDSGELAELELIFDSARMPAA